MNIQELEAFWWIVQTGSFNRAAERLYLTQPSVTARIQVLERELGQTLFERKPRGVRLTDAGRALLPHAKKVLLDIRKARQAVTELLTVTGGTLTLGCALTTSTYSLPGVLSRYKQLFPAVEIAVRAGRSDHVIQLVLDEIVQMGLVHAPIQPHPELQHQLLYKDEIVLVVSPSHPLAREERVNPGRLFSEPLLNPDKSGSYWTLIEQFWASHGVVPKVSMELDSIEAAKGMVLHGLGVTLLPRECVEQEVRNGQLISVQVSGAPPLIRQTLLVHRRGKVWSGVVQAFLSVLEEAFSVQLGLHSEAG